MLVFAKQVRSHGESSLLLSKARIYHVDDAINCDGSFCNVGGNDHLPSRWSSREARTRGWFKDLLLLHWRQGGIKRYSYLRCQRCLTQHPYQLRWMDGGLSFFENSEILNWGTSSPFSGKRELSFLNCPWCPNHTESNSHNWIWIFSTSHCSRFASWIILDLPSSLPIKPKINPIICISAPKTLSYQRSNMLVTPRSGKLAQSPLRQLETVRCHLRARSCES